MGSKGAKDVTERGAAYLSDAAAQGQRLAQDVDGRLEEYTGKSSEAWMKDAARMMRKHPWKAVALVGLIAFVLGKARG
jgi:hypothetical protein